MKQLSKEARLLELTAKLMPRSEQERERLLALLKEHRKMNSPPPPSNPLEDMVKRLEEDLRARGIAVETAGSKPDSQSRTHRFVVNFVPARRNDPTQS